MDETGDFIPVIGHQDKDNINSPFNVAGQMIALRKGGHRVYWNAKGTQPEVFPECPDTGFYALKEIGWYKIGELSPDEVSAGAKEKSAATRKRRSPTQQPATRRVKKSKKLSDSESEAQSEVESSDSESEVEYDDSVTPAGRSRNTYRAVPTPRSGYEKYWRLVGRSFRDNDDDVSFTVVAVVVRIMEKGKIGDDEKILFYQYYNTDIYPNGPPKHEQDYEFSTCAEMDPDSDEYGEWAEWELIPDSSTDPIKPSVSVARSENSTTTDKVDAPKWKGYAILTEDELQELRRKQESDAVCESRMRRRRR